MIKDATKQIIRRTLQSSFDKEQFLNFTKNLLNHINEDKAFHAHGYVKEQFKKTANIIKTYERLGTYTDPNEKKIDILVVYLAKDNSIDRARTSLRNFVADYLKGRDQKDAALVAFVSPSQDDWRFSLIKMEYKFEEGATGKMKVKEEFTPARRWSFLVGSKESSHTAQSRLAPILEDDENKPTLEQLEDAFNIEKVTKEFFEKYRELFLGLKDNLDEMVKNDAKIKADFAEKDVDTVDFAKKLLGQIVFLYFLQKKGWFGVERDANWGTGPKDFLRQLYNKKHSGYKNFFNEILEPMFYEALARERDDDYYGRFNCKIPFLNGGLFDPIGNYDWVHTDINLDNELFSNSRPTKQGDIGDGILDVFDRYNFTVREDEPLEKEVAVDPEMLGKVFENLLEVKDRKSKGTYYTPREIVHYMCEQSLINYLATELPEVDKNDLEEFIKIGDQVLENEYWLQEKGDDNGSKIPASIKKNAETIDQKLAEIKVCDPAIGSGAFPVGMMGEIVNARLALNPFLCHSGLDPESSSLECAGRTAYDFKMQAITNSIYGVDIDPGAVEIAKLRLWLSLVVDENDIKQIKPLPNLDYKIMQGNSLLEEFEGIKLFDESIIPQEKNDREDRIKKANLMISELQREYIKLHSQRKLSKSKEQLIDLQLKEQKKIIANSQEKPKSTGSIDLFNQVDDIKEKWNELTELHKKIVNESNRQEKKQMLDRASELEWQFIEATLRREDKIDSLKKVEQYKKNKAKPFFLWHLHFAEVFQSKNGFDVVMGNPPYGASLTGELRNTVIKNLGKVPDHEIYYYFIELAKKLLVQNGTNSYIVPNTFLFNVFAADYRKNILDNWCVNILIDCTAFKLFESATVYNAITIFSKTKDSKLVGYKNTLGAGTFEELLKRDTLFTNKEDLLLNNINWGLVFKLSPETLSIITKIKSSGQKVSDIFPEISQGLIAYDKYAGQDEEVIKNRSYHHLEKINESVKEWLWGSDVKPYAVEWNGKEFIDYGSGIANPRLPKYFKGSRILIREITNPKIFAAYTDKELYHDPAIIVVLDNHKDTLLLLGILNSKLATFYHFNASPKATKGAFPKILVKDIKEFPVPKLNTPDLNKAATRIKSIVDQILTMRKSDSKADTKDLEGQIDQMVYKLYDLTPEEIKIVESA